MANRTRHNLQALCAALISKTKVIFSFFVPKKLARVFFSFFFVQFCHVNCYIFHPKKRAPMDVVLKMTCTPYKKLRCDFLCFIFLGLLYAS